MLTDHIRWKGELSRIIKELRNACAAPRSAEADFTIEKSFLISGYVLRKMIEGGKVSNVSHRNRLHVKVWPRKQSAFSQMQIGKVASGADAQTIIEAEFDTSKVSSESFSPQKISDMIVHSSSLILHSRENNIIDEILINSDNYIDKIHRINVLEYCNFLTEIADEELAGFSIVLDTLTGRTWLGARRKGLQV